MSAFALIGTVAAYTTLGTLAWSGFRHARSPQALVHILQRHGWRKAMQWPLAASVIGLELLVGIVGLVAVLAGSPVIRVLSLSMAALVYAAYALYGAALARRADAVPCGCSSVAQHPINIWVVARAGMLLAGAIFAAAASTSMRSPWPLDASMLLAILASGALGIILWELPAALHHPGSAMLVREGVKSPIVV
jgi:hypothetical protein